MSSARGGRLTLTFQDACRLLFPRTGGAKTWSLGPTLSLLESLGRPDRLVPAIHIGGTNGKGSVAMLVYQALQAAGWRTALYTSPHLVDVRERIVIDDRPITTDAFAAWTSRLLPVIERTGASFFEATTAIAFADFAARTADIAVLEVGLGGRLDSTNVVDPIASAVTRVAVEHTEYLGNDLDQIAREKGGIAKAGRPFVIGEVRSEIAAQLESCALEVGAKPVRLDPRATYEGPLGLFGKHQRRNAAVAAKLLEQLPHPWRPDAEAVSRGFARASFPGRFDRRGKWLFDVAHNPDAIEVLLQTLDEAATPRPLHGLVSVLGDKDWKTMLTALLEKLDRVWVTQAPTAPVERRWNLNEVAEYFSERVEAEPSFEVALERVVVGAATVVVCGSFHTVGDAMARLPGFAPLG